MRPNGIFRPNYSSTQWKGLLHWWPTVGQNANGRTLFDLAGGLHGSFGTATDRQYEEPVGVSLEFGAHDSYDITCGTFDPSDEVSLAMWMRTPTIGGSRRRFFGIATSFELLIDTSSAGHFGADLYESSGGGVVSTGRVDDDVWRHFLVTHDASHNVAVYINGVLDNSGTTNGADPGSAALGIGYRTGSSERFDGNLADIRVYDRVLDANDAAHMYSPASRWDLYQSEIQPSFFVFTSILSASLTDGLRIGDSQAVAAIKQASLTDGLQIGEALARTKSVVASLVDGLSLTENHGPQLTAQASLSDALHLGDSQSAGQVLLANLIDGLHIGDSQTAGQVLLASLIDSLQLSDSPAAVIALLASLTDGLRLSDSPSAIAALLASLVDGLQLGDSEAAGLVLLGSLTDGIQVGDNPVATAALLARLIDGLHLGDSLAAKVTLLAAIADGLQMSDDPAAAASLLANIADGLQIADSPAATASLLARLIDGLQLSDTVLVSEANGEITITFITKTGTITFTTRGA